MVHRAVRVDDGILEETARSFQREGALVIRLGRIVRALVGERAKRDALRARARGERARGDTAKSEHVRVAGGRFESVACGARREMSSRWFPTRVRNARRVRVGQLAIPQSRGETKVRDWSIPAVPKRCRARFVTMDFRASFPRSRQRHFSLSIFTDWRSRRIDVERPRRGRRTHGPTRESRRRDGGGECAQMTRVCGDTTAFASARGTTRPPPSLSRLVCRFRPVSACRNRPSRDAGHFSPTFSRGVISRHVSPLDPPLGVRARPSRTPPRPPLEPQCSPTVLDSTSSSRRCV